MTWTKKFMLPVVILAVAVAMFPPLFLCYNELRKTAENKEKDHA